MFNNWLIVKSGLTALRTSLQFTIDADAHNSPNAWRLPTTRLPPSPIMKINPSFCLKTRRSPNYWKLFLALIQCYSWRGESISTDWEKTMGEAEIASVYSIIMYYCHIIPGCFLFLFQFLHSVTLIKVNCNEETSACCEQLLRRLK